MLKSSGISWLSTAQGFIFYYYYHFLFFLKRKGETGIDIGTENVESREMQMRREDEYRY